MTTDIKELVKRLRIFKHRDANAAADALEAMAGEVERLKASLKDAQGRAHARALLEGAGIDADGCLAEVARDFARRAIAAEAERDRTRADYEAMKAHNKELFGKLSAAELERDRLKAALDEAVKWMDGCAVSGGYPTWYVKARKALAGETT